MKNLNEDLSQLIELKKEDEKTFLFEQYKLTIASLDNINRVRENSNKFWGSLNGAIIAGVAHLRDIEGISGTQKSYLIWTAIVVGITLSIIWLSFLTSIKKSVDVRNEMILQFEKYFPAKNFTLSISGMNSKKGGSSLSIKEMIVPLLFMVGYTFFAIAFYFFPKVAISIIQ